MGRHPRAGDPARRADVHLVARRGAGDRSLPRARRRGGLPARRHGARRRDHAVEGRRSRCRSRSCSGASAARRSARRSCAEVPVVLIAYDLLELDGRDVRGEPLVVASRELARVDRAHGAQLRRSCRRRSCRSTTWDDARAAHADGARAERRRADAQAARRAYGVGRRKGGWWKWKVQPFTRGRGDDLRAGRARPARVAAHRLHVRRLGRRRARAVRQGVLRADRRRDPRARRVDPREHGREVRPGAAREAGAGVRARLRGHPGVAAAQVGRRGALSAHRCGGARTRRRRGRRHDRRRLRAMHRGVATSIELDAADRAVVRVAGLDAVRRSSARCGTRTCAGESGLVHAATGTGKTLAAWWGPLLEWLAERAGSTAERRAAARDARRARRRCASSGSRRCARSPPTPHEALRQPLARPRHSVDARVAHRRHVGRRCARDRARRLPTALVTTPESAVAPAHARRRARDVRRPSRSSSSTSGTS